MARIMLSCLHCALDLPVMVPACRLQLFKLGNLALLNSEDSSGFPQKCKEELQESGGVDLPCTVNSTLMFPN